MRKITQEAVKAFWGGYYFKQGNTEVVKSDKSNYGAQSIKMYLHGNCIAKRVLGDGLYLSHCGWETNVTKERLNGILSVYQSTWIYQKQKDFQWYLVKDGKETEFKDGWNRIE